MTNVLMEKKYRETLIPGLVALLVMAGMLISLIIAGFLFAVDMDEEIESAARKSYAFKTYLKGDNIQIHSQDSVVTLTGTVASEPHLLLAAETVADLPGVKNVDNRLVIE